MEGTSAAQTLALPGGSNGSNAPPAAAAGSSAGGSNGSNAPLGLAALGGLKSLASSMRSFVSGAAAAAAGGEDQEEGGGAAMPPVHAVLLEQLDLVPSKGGIEAAGLRFMQLQVRWGGGCASCGVVLQTSRSWCANAWGDSDW